MYTYRDMTFCANKECPNEQCYRRLTDEVKKKAKACNMPIAYSIDFECIEDNDVVSEIQNPTWKTVVEAIR